MNTPLVMAPMMKAVTAAERIGPGTLHTGAKRQEWTVLMKYLCDDNKLYIH